MIDRNILEIRKSGNIFSFFKFSGEEEEYEFTVGYKEWIFLFLSGVGFGAF